MKVNKKMALLSLAGTLAASGVATGVAVPASLATSTQSTVTAVESSDTSTVDNGSSSSNTTTPTETSTSTKVASATIPTSDSLSSEVVIDGSFNLNLNNKLSELFGTGTLSSDSVSLLTNGSQYNDVNLVLDKTSGNVRNKTFSLKATPVTNTTWSDGTTTTKTVSVSLSNLTIKTTSTDATDTDTSTDTVVTYATAPTADVFNLSHEVDAGDHASLNKYLLETIGTGDDVIATFGSVFANATSYSNVTVSYLEGSANANTSTFYLSVTPSGDAVWTDGTTATKQVSVNMPNLTVKTTTADALAPSVDTYTLADDAGTFTTNTQLDTYLLSNFATSSLAGTYSNVGVQYKAGSADWYNGTFTIYVQPQSTHTWTDGTTIQKELTITISNLTNHVKTVTAPTTWSSNAVMRGQWGNMTGWSTGNIDYDAAGEVIAENLTNSYPGLTYVSVVSDKGKYTRKVDEYNQTRVAVFYITVKLSDGYKWSDGSSQESTKDIKVYIFSSTIEAVGGGYTKAIGVYKEMSGLKSGNGLDQYGLPCGYYVSNTIYQYQYESKATMSSKIQKIVLAELQTSYPDWNVSISNIGTVRNGTWGEQFEWYYRITFTNDEGVTVGNDGWMFVSTQGVS